MPEVAARTAPQGGNLFDLAGSFYVPPPHQPALPAHPGVAGFLNRVRSGGSFARFPNQGAFDQKIDTGFVQRIDLKFALARQLTTFDQNPQ
jgi:hypothetical protein